MASEQNGAGEAARLRRQDKMESLSLQEEVNTFILKTEVIVNLILAKDLTPDMIQCIGKLRDDCKSYCVEFQNMDKKQTVLETKSNLDQAVCDFCHQSTGANLNSHDKWWTLSAAELDRLVTNNPSNNANIQHLSLG